MGEHVKPGMMSISCFADFHCVDESRSNPEYATDNILLGDLHDRNILIDICGNTQVIDCNLFLNTPDLGKGGKWMIPELTFNEVAISKMDYLLDRLVPVSVNRNWLIASVLNDADRLKRELEGQGYLTGTVKLSPEENYLVEVDPEDPSGVLLTNTRQAEILLSEYPDLSDEAKAALARGETVAADGRMVRFSPDKGHVIPVPVQTAKKRPIQRTPKKEETPERLSSGLKL